MSGIFLCERQEEGGGYMWTKQIFGMDLIYFIECFIIYSFIGWVVESIYMSICNKKWTNRGFSFGPFCPIYGFGAIIGSVVMNPFSESFIKLYIVGAVLATIFEYLVGMLMFRVFDEVWWDYNEKPFNYRGMVCLESTLAWGFYAIVIVRYLNYYILMFVNNIPIKVGIIVCRVVLICYAIDFIYHCLKALGIDKSKQKERIVEVYRSIRTRF